MAIVLILDGDETTSESCHRFQLSILMKMKAASKLIMLAVDAIMRLWYLASQV